MPNEDRAITRLRSFHQRSRACSETPPCLECAPLGYDAFVSSSMYHRYISDSDSRLAFKAAHFGLGTRVSEHALGKSKGNMSFCTRYPAAGLVRMPRVRRRKSAYNRLSFSSAAPRNPDAS